MNLFISYFFILFNVLYDTEYIFYPDNAGFDSGCKVLTADNALITIPIGWASYLNEDNSSAKSSCTYVCVWILILINIYTFYTIFHIKFMSAIPHILIKMRLPNNYSFLLIIQ